MTPNLPGRPAATHPSEVAVEVLAVAGDFGRAEAAVEVLAAAGALRASPNLLHPSSFILFPSTLRAESLRKSTHRQIIKSRETRRQVHFWRVLPQRRNGTFVPKNTHFFLKIVAEKTTKRNQVASVERKRRGQ
jgi:hypothetical protein